MDIVYDNTLTREMKSYMNRDKYLSMSPHHQRIYKCKIVELISAMARVEITEECGCIINESTRSYAEKYTSKLCDIHLKETKYHLWVYKKMSEIDDHIYEIRERYYVKFVKRSNGMDKNIVPIKYMYENLNIPKVISSISTKQAEDFIVHKNGNRWYCCSNRVDLYADILVKENKVCEKVRRTRMEEHGISLEENTRGKFLQPKYTPHTRYIP